MKKSDNIEIERKFLVRGDFRPFVSRSFRITQGYLCASTERTVRIRIKADKGFITIKGKTGNTGISRFEWEKEITKEDAENLLLLCQKGMIDKVRHEVEYDEKIFEVDEFFGENEGLLLAELELQSEDESYTKPDWLGTEVTGDRRYYNSYLSIQPYKTWK